MHHVHLDEVESTQTYLKENLEELRSIQQNVLVSTRSQTLGQGRSGNSWQFFDNSLAFSFTLEPNEELTLTSLEIGVLLTKFFKEYDSLEILLKWPNDLLNSDLAKLGGILCTYKDPKTIVVGIGINLGKSDVNDSDFPYPVSSLSSDLVLTENDYSEIPRAIYDFILTNRIRKNALKPLWDKVCVHLNKSVSIIDGENKKTGIFKGISHDGSAQLEIDGEVETVMNGSLFIN
ncbi:MAG: biotin--[acetyl-CoA-carboxylase] ligase [Bacteriovoracaceae bacterium]|nr:biotin--[acetyl-CoA-carboxylase] ligase [Bacteriovoracaceae bacterium]